MPYLVLSRLFFVLAATACGSACASAPASPTRPPSPVVVTALKPIPRPLTAEERVAEALRRLEARADARWPRVESTVNVLDTPDRPSIYIPPPQPAKRGVITLESDPAVTQVISNTRWDAFAEEALAVRGPRCFGFQSRPGELVVALTPAIQVAAGDAVGRCLADGLPETSYDGALAQKVRLTARPRHPFVRAGADAAQTMRSTEGELAEEIALLRTRIEATRGTPDGLRLQLVLGTKLVDGAMSKPQGGSLAEAEDIFEAVRQGARGGDLRPVALERLAYVAELLGHEKVAMGAHLALVCPNGVDRSQDHARAYWDAWEAAHPLLLPRDRVGREKAARGYHAVQGGPQSWTEETVYRSPFAACAGAFPESWFAIGRWEAASKSGEVRDDAAGPFRLARAADALRRAIATGEAESRARRRFRRSQRHAVLPALAREGALRCAAIPILGSRARVTPRIA